MTNMEINIGIRNPICLSEDMPQKTTPKIKTPAKKTN
jgi:hypothetical protein